jgi:hypothetical protein
MKNNKLDYENNNGAACVSRTAPSENNYHQQNNNNFHNNKENILSPDDKFLVPDVPLFSFYKAPIKGTTHPELDVSISDVVCKLKGDEYKSLIERCRSNGKSTLSMIKEKMLDFVTFSGSFSYRNADSITNYSGYICIDLDDLVDPEETKHLLSQDTSVPPLLIFTSPSGKGIKVVYKVAGDQSDHSQYFDALCNYLIDTYNLKADLSGKDVPRACFLSHDPDLYFNVDSLNVVPLGYDFISEYSSEPDPYIESNSIPLTITEVTDSDVEHILSIATNIIERSQDGDKHRELCKASYLLGGYVGGGVIHEADARNTLREAIENKPNVMSITIAYRTIDDGIREGKKKPLYSVSKWKVLYESLENSFLDELLNTSFPLSVFPKELEDIIIELNNNLYFPIDYLAPSILFTASVALGKSAKINLKDGWSEYANVYIALVGSPGVTKSPPLKNATSPLNDIDKKNYDHYRHQKQQYDNNISNDIIDPPVLIKHLVNDITLESLYQVHSNNPNGIGVYKDELLSWIKDMVRYRNGSDEQAWNSIFSNAQVSVNRVGSDPLLIIDPFISVIGTIQPGVMRQFISESRQSSGFIDRVLFCYPDSFRVNKWNNNGINADTKSNYKSIIDKLLSLSGDDPVILNFSADASSLWEEFYNNNQLKKNDPNIPDSIKGIYAKMDSYVPRLALILQALYWASDSGTLSEIDEKAMQGAIDLSKYFIHCAIKARSKVNNNSQNLYSKKEVAIILKKLNISVRKIAKAIDVSATSVQNWVGDIKE